MKHFWLLLSVVLILCYATLTPSFGQLPRTISYQGYAVNPTGTPLNEPHNITLRIFSSGGVQLFQETYNNVEFHNGVFNIIIGRGAVLPVSMKFDETYYLGVTIDNQSELVPRTEFTAAPYALHSSVADVALLVDTNAVVVRTINGKSGVITLQGGGGTTITNSGGVFTISSSGGGGSGIQGIQNSDGTLTITNPNGPTATIGVADGGIMTAKLGANAVTTLKISDGAVSAAKINSTGATTNQILTANGTGGVQWQTVSVPAILSLPYAQSVSNPSSLFSLINTGTGAAISGTSSATAVAAVNGNTLNATGIGVLGLTSDGGSGVTTNAGVCGSAQSGYGVSGNASTGEGMRGYSSSTGIGIHGIVGSGATTARAAVFENTNSATTGNVLEATCAGTGKAGSFRINNAVNSSNALEASTNGTGHGLNAAAAGNSASGVFGSNSGSGFGVTGSTTDGVGVYGVSTNNIGVHGVHSSNIGIPAAVSGETNSATGANGAISGATGVYGEVTIVNPGAWSAGLRGINRGTAGNGVGTIGYHGGNGYGVYGEVVGANGGSAIVGVAPNGSWAGHFFGKIEVSVDNALKPATNTWTIASDARLKRDIRPFSDGLDVLLQINPVRYYYNGLAGLPTEKENIGIVAQDMQRVAPYTVETSALKLHPEDTQKTEILTYNSNAITYVTINAVKELNAKIAQLEARLEMMEQLLQSKGIDTRAAIAGTK